MPYKDLDKRRAYHSTYGTTHRKERSARAARRREEIVTLHKTWLDAHPGYRPAWAAARRAKLQALKAGPCVDCGDTFPPECMDFDHVRGEKVANVGSLTTFSNVKLMAEIAKCDLVCANCHRIRTQARRLARIA